MLRKTMAVKIAAPNLPPAAIIEVDRLRDEDFLEGGLIQDCTWQQHTAEHLLIKQVAFKNVVFQDVGWPYANLTDVVFEQCDLSNVDFQQCLLERVRFSNCKMVGSNLSEASLKHVVMEHCHAAYAVLRYAHCKQVHFNHSAYTEADFYAAVLQDVCFTKCNIDKAQLSGIALKGIDLSTCQFNQLGVTVEDLRGCIIAPEQAMALANVFGVVIKR